MWCLFVWLSSPTNWHWHSPTDLFLAFVYNFVCTFFKMGQSWPLFVYFRSFLVTISIQIEKSIDGVLGIQTQGCRMVGADETTELWRPPILFVLWLYKSFLKNVEPIFALFSHLFSSFKQTSLQFYDKYM